MPKSSSYLSSLNNSRLELYSEGKCKEKYKEAENLQTHIKIEDHKQHVVLPCCEKKYKEMYEEMKNLQNCVKSKDCKELTAYGSCETEKCKSEGNKDVKCYIEQFVGQNCRDNIPIWCRSIRIGSLRVTSSPTFLPLFLTNNGFKFHVCTVTDVSEIVTIELCAQDIAYSVGHFGRSLPLLFVHTTKRCAGNIRNLLRMTAEDGHYFDPESKDERQKRITFVIEMITDMQRSFLRHVFPGTSLLNEVDQKTANEILVISTPTQTASHMGFGRTFLPGLGMHLYHKEAHHIPHSDKKCQGHLKDEKFSQNHSFDMWNSSQ